MPSKSIAARLKGDDYQARFFWYLAVQLLLPYSNIKSVSIEYDAATHVDDVAVFYMPPDRSDWGGHQEAEFYQVKYHVDNYNGYSADALIDPSFIKSPRDSLLQRFYKAYNTLKPQYSKFTLSLVSNWTWYRDDAIAKSIRDGCELPEKLFQVSERSDLGKIRRKWIEHLGTNEETFLDFGQKLRFSLNYFNNPGLGRALSDRLQNAGLIPYDSLSLIFPYDDLARKLVENQILNFDKDSLFELCKAMDLVRSDPVPRTTKTIGVRSFKRFAENIGIDTDGYICLADKFDGRSPREGISWNTIANSVKDYFDSQLPKLSKNENKLVLDCHTSLSFLAGYLVTPRAQVYPAGPRPSLEMVKPARNVSPNPESLWSIKMQLVMEGAPNLAVAISVANQIDNHVIDYLRKNRDDAGSLLILEPVSGTGSTSIRDADHAWALASSLIQIVRRCSVDSRRTLMFISGPNFLTFFIGQLSHPLGNLTLFEYDFDNPVHKTYCESFSIPLQPVSE